MEHPKQGNISYRQVDFDPFAEQQNGPFPTTEPQREIWTNVRISGYAANCAYNESVSLTLKGNFDPELFRKAASSVLARHEALRSIFAPDGLTFTIGAETDARVDFVDLSAFPGPERERQLKKLQDEAVTTEFDLESGKLARFQVVKSASAEHVVMLTFHHIVCDGWSLGIVMQDLGKFYSAFHTGTQVQLDPAFSFCDYAVSEAAYQDKTAENYWTQLYRNDVPVLELPVNKNRPAFRTFNARRTDIGVEPALVEQLKKRGAAQGCSYVTTLLVAFEIFLQRITGSNDIVTGVPAAGQSLDGKDSLVGHAVHLLPVRAQVDPNSSFNQYLKARKPLILDAYDHQHYTFGSLLTRLNIPRDPSRIPLVPVSFNVDLGITSGVEFAGCTMHFATNARSFENFELFINATGSGNQLTLECTYNTDLFEDDAMQLRMREFVVLLNNLVEHPDDALGSLNILVPEERQQVLHEWNGISLPYDKTTIHAAFEQVAKQNEAAIAVRDHGKEITFGELNARANRMAKFLIEKGAGPGKLIGVCLSRNIDMVVALYAVLKSGSAYVPLDPVYPAERIAFIVGDSGAFLVLTDAQSSHVLPSLKIEVLDLASIDATKFDAANPAVGMNPEDAAYCMYTSGSTGNPKGVVVEHRNVAALTAWAKSYFTGEQIRGVLGSTTICFDLSIFELFVTPCLGGTVVLVRDVLELASCTDTDGISLVNTVPSAFAALLKTGSAIPKTIHTVILCGEPLPAALVDQIYGISGMEKVVDLYGPTEDTVYSTVTLRTPGGPATIGKVIPNSRLYLLDAFLQPVPLGLPGEIFLGGDGVTRGYLNRPELTAERFVKDPFSDQPHARLYRTGDLARFRPDGNLEFIGRADNQVKVRGFRIELGEIESRILKHAGVKECVVVVREDVPGDKRIVAYVVRENAADADFVPMRESLRNVLPEYMVPSHFLGMELLPKTPNGKIDRKALPRPEMNLSAKSGFEEPATPVEVTLASIWCAVLHIPKVGRKDNFFELGGHSLLAVQMFNRVEKQLGYKIELAMIFRAPTIEELAHVITNKEALKPWSCLVPLQPNGTKPPLICIHMHNGNINRWRALLKSIDSDQPVFAIQPRGLDENQEPHRTIEDMAEFYNQILLKEFPNTPYRLLGLCFGGMVVFEMAARLQKQGKQVAYLGMINNYAPPANPLLYRFQIGMLKVKKMGLVLGSKFLVNKIVGLAGVSKIFEVPDDFLVPQVDAGPTLEASIRIGRDLRTMHSVALLHYHPKHLYRGNLNLYRNSGPIEPFFNSLLGWNRLVQGSIDTTVIEGSNNDTIITDAPYNEWLGAAINQHLNNIKS